MRPSSVSSLPISAHDLLGKLLQAKEPFYPLPWAYLLVGLGALNSSLHIVNGWLAAAVLCTITVLAYLHYVTTVVNQVGGRE